MVSRAHAGEREAWCPVEVHPFQKEVFKQSLGSWARWDAAEKVWWVRSEEADNVAQLGRLLDAATLDPGQVWRKASQGAPLGVPLHPSLGEPVSERQRLASAPVVALDAYRQALEEDEAEIAWQWGDRVPIRAARVDTGYGVLRGLGPEDSQGHGNSAQYLLVYEPHEAPAGLERQYVVMRGSLEWRELLALARRGEATILAALSDHSNGRDDRVLRVKPDDCPLPFAELYLERRQRRLPGAAAVGIQLAQQPALSHTGGLNTMSLIYCPAGAKEIAALVRGLAQLDMEAEDAVTLLQGEPGAWLATQREMREALQHAPVQPGGTHCWDYQRASYAHSSVWVARALDRLADEAT